MPFTQSTNPLWDLVQQTNASAYNSQSGMQSAYNSQSAYGSILHPQTPEELKRTVEYHRSQSILAQQRYDEMMKEIPLKGPTPNEMEKYPSLQSLWEELRVSMALCGINRK